MKKVFVVFVTAALMAVYAITGSAQAGNSVKLNMGGPLGTFTAHGKGKYVGSSSLRSKSHSKSHSNSNRGSSYRRALAKKKAAERQRAIAARKAAAARRARIAAAKKAAAKKEAQRMARRHETAKANRRAAAKARSKATDYSSRDNDEKITAVKTSPVKASAIAGANTLLDGDDAENETDVSDAKDDGKPDDVSDTPVDLARADSDAQSEAETKETGKSVGSGECKKYVPSAGLTISVPCGE